MQLPLFPLNSILFPTMPLRLHIFEERYKEMINECIENKVPFGVVLLKEGLAENPRFAKPYLVGTTAHITQVRRLAYGRINLLAMGRNRFKINSLDKSSRSFLLADVDLLPLVSTNPSILDKGASKLRPLMESYLSSLSDAGQLELKSSQLPDDAMVLAYLAAVLLQAEDSVKQDILESVDTHDMLVKLLQIYHREVALIDILLSPPDVENENNTPFSLS